MITLTLPALGADMDQGTLLEWRVAPGDAVKKGDVVAVVDTSKAAIDVEVWQAGTVHELLAEPGETLPVGAPLATLLEPGEQAAGPVAAAPVAAPPAPPTPAAHPASLASPAPPAALAATPPRATPATTPSPAHHRVAPTARKRAAELGVALERVTGSGPDGAVTALDVEHAAGAGAQPAGARRPVSPAARRLAAERGLDPESLAGSGPGGAVTRADVERAAAEPRPKPAAAERAALMRRTIAAAMSRSKREIPHYYLAEDVPLDRALGWLQGFNATRPVTERLLPAVLYVKAVALAARRYPEMNGFFTDGGFRAADSVHLGVAISLRQGGLIAPALHDCQDKPLDDLMRELADLVRRARAGSLRSSELADPTLTLTNLGDQGVRLVQGIIYPPQVALVGFGRVSERAWARDGGLRALPVVTVSLAADHRVSDGHRGALFLAEVSARLQAPETL